MGDRSTVRVEILDDVAVLHLQRGERGNALDPQLVEDLLEALRIASRGVLTVIYYKAPSIRFRGIAGSEPAVYGFLLPIQNG